MFVHLYNAIRDGLCVRHPGRVIRISAMDGKWSIHGFVSSGFVTRREKTWKKNRHETNIGPKGAAEDITAC